VFGRKRIPQRVVESAVSAEFIERARCGCAEDSARYSKLRLLVVSVVLFCATIMPARASTITVTNTNDNGPGSLRQALMIAHDGDTIRLAVTGTITLTSGGLPVNKSLTISGPGKDQLSIDGNQASLVFGIFPDKTATISGLTIRNGQAGILNEHGTLTVSNCAVSGNSEIGLFNDGIPSVLTVSNCVVSGNSSGIYNYYGEASVSNCIVSSNQYGGVFNYGVSGGPDDHILGIASLTIADSIINDNSGPGVDNNAGGVTIVDTTISGNSVGGGVYTYQDGGKIPGNLTVMNSTISGNFASSDGGGIACGKSGLTIVNSTISGNSAGAYGGGIASGSFGMMIVNSTVSGNSAATCGGVCGEVEIANTILNANASGNIDGTVTSHGYNISSDDGSGHLNGPGDQINTDPLLGPLQDNGGPTLTHLPLPGSPAIDAGDPNFTRPPYHDQRGPCFYRVFGRRIDVGSVETQPRPRCVTPAPRPTPH
jgi:Right handed beta helix region